MQQDMGFAVESETVFVIAPKMIKFTQAPASLGDHMNRQSDWLIGTTLALTLLGVTLTGTVFYRPWLFSVIAWFMLLVYVLYSFVTRNRFLSHLLLFALAADLPQLLVDWYHVRVVQTLIYDYAFFRIWETPDYILAGWGFAFFQLGYLLRRLAPRFGWFPLSLVITLGGHPDPLLV